MKKRRRSDRKKYQAQKRVELHERYEEYRKANPGLGLAEAKLSPDKHNFFRGVSEYVAVLIIASVKLGRDVSAVIERVKEERKKTYEATLPHMGFERFASRQSGKTDIVRAMLNAAVVTALPKEYQAGAIEFLSSEREDAPDAAALEFISKLPDMKFRTDAEYADMEAASRRATGGDHHVADVLVAHARQERTFTTSVSFKPAQPVEFVSFEIPLPPGMSLEQAQAIVDEANAEDMEQDDARCDHCGGGGFDPGCDGPCNTCDGTGRVPF